MVPVASQDSIVTESKAEHTGYLDIPTGDVTRLGLIPRVWTVSDGPVLNSSHEAALSMVNRGPTPQLGLKEHSIEILKNDSWQMYSLSPVTTRYSWPKMRLTTSPKVD